MVINTTFSFDILYIYLLKYSSVIEMKELTFKILDNKTDIHEIERLRCITCYNRENVLSSFKSGDLYRSCPLNSFYQLEVRRLSMNPKLLRFGLFTGMAAIGSTVVPALTKKATKKAAKQQIRKSTATIDFDNMGPEIVRKDGSDTKREDK